MPFAARINDLHICPLASPTPPPVPHVGGPIVGPGVPTVLIGGAPAAVVGDTCVCAGPPDVIVKGSCSVLIGGKPAARQGDLTAHGGVIVMGCPTVMIGDLIVPGALTSFCPAIGLLGSMPLAERLNKEKTILEDIARFDPKAAAELDQTRHDRDMLLLADATYKEDMGVLPPGYKEASDEDLKKLGVTPKKLSPDMKVFRAEDDKGKPHYVLAYRGTETGDDVWTDVQQGNGYETEAYRNGNTVATEMAKSGERVELTGHSKGGGQAASGSAVSGLPATTYNAAGVHDNTLDRAGVTPKQREAMDTNIRAYNNSRDPLNAAQDNRGLVLGGVAYAARLVPYIGPLLGAAFFGFGARGSLPKARGQRIEVPAHSKQNWGPKEGHSPDALNKGMNEQIDNKLKETCGC